MEIRSFIHPTTNFEFIKYYWPDSLSGQANSASRSLGELSEVHTPHNREDGTKTCSCGLVFWNLNLQPNTNPWGISLDDFGHRNHQTGDPEPLHKTSFREHSQSESPIFECEWCGSSSMLDGFFNGDNEHLCGLENLPEDRFIWTAARLEVEPKSFTMRLFQENLEQLNFGLLDIKLTLKGAFISSTSPEIHTLLPKLLNEGQLLLSEEVRRDSEIDSDWPPQYVNPSAKDFEEFWSEEKLTDSRYWLHNLQDFGYFKFSNAGISVDSLVRYTMTKDIFTINAPRSNVPVIRIPVIWLG